MAKTRKVHEVVQGYEMSRELFGKHVNRNMRRWSLAETATLGGSRCHSERVTSMSSSRKRSRSPSSNDKGPESKRPCLAAETLGAMPELSLMLRPHLDMRTRARLRAVSKMLKQTDKDFKYQGWMIALHERYSFTEGFTDAWPLIEESRKLLLKRPPPDLVHSNMLDDTPSYDGDTVSEETVLIWHTTMPPISEYALCLRWSRNHAAWYVMCGGGSVEFGPSICTVEQAFERLDRDDLSYLHSAALNGIRHYE